MPLCWFSLWFFLVWIRPVYPTSSLNVTINDQPGDRVTSAHVDYTPVGGWNFHRTGANTTWYENTFNSGLGNDTIPATASVDFYGSAVYVYCFTTLPASTDMTFSVDENLVGSFTSSPMGGNQTSPGDTNSTLVFASVLSKGNHTLTIINGHANGGRSLVRLDRIVYTTDQGTELPDNEMPPSDPNTSKVNTLTGVLVTFCILFTILLVYLLYRIFAKRASDRNTGMLPTASGQYNRSSGWGWVTRYLKFNPSKASVALSSRFRSEGRRSFTVLQNPSSPPGILAEAEPDIQQKSTTESRWALIMSWRDRTVREAEIPSLPPTSSAPTTVFSGPSLRTPAVGPLRVQRPQDRLETTRTQPRRMFAVMNV